MSLMRAFCNGGLLASRSIAARSAITSARPSIVQNSLQLYRTSSPMQVGARSALYRFDFDNGHGMDHHWKFERYLATVLMTVLPAGLYFQHPALDYALAGIMVTHAHMGLDQVVFDYLHYRPRWLYLPVMGCVWMCSIMAFAGLCYYTYARNGFCGALKELWSLHYEKKNYGLL